MSDLRRLTLADIAKLGDKETIPSFKARIEKVDEPRTGSGQYGVWTAQNLFVQDDTGKSKVVVWNHDDFTTADIGEERLFECSNGDKGLSGIKVKVESYFSKKHNKQVTAKVIDVGKQAEISRIGSSPAPARLSQAEPHQTAPTPEKSPISQIKTKLGQHANSLILCFDAAFYVGSEVRKKHGKELTMEDIRSLAVHFNISMDRQFAITNLPAGPLERKEPPKEDMRALWVKLATPAADAAIGFAIYRGWLIEPTDTLAQWPEQNLPKSQAEAVKLLAEIQEWSEQAHNPPEPEDDSVPF